MNVTLCCHHVGAFLMSPWEVLKQGKSLLIVIVIYRSRTSHIILSHPRATHQQGYSFGKIWFDLKSSGMRNNSKSIKNPLRTHTHLRSITPLMKFTETDSNTLLSWTDCHGRICIYWTVPFNRNGFLDFNFIFSLRRKFKEEKIIWQKILSLTYGNNN